MVYTMMADAPAEVVAAAVAALPPAAGEGPLRRLGRGLARVGSWLDPLG
ncbi:MAG TPA: hypothetical protein VKP64_07865 [Mycobacteriales bacterium]|nr:hypothetical protein [Mycobacteriales bacterium]